jgi:hypothetical protein
VPFSATTFTAIVGVIEFAVGITILAVRPSLGAFIASAWLALIAINLVLGGHFDIAVRDVVLAIGLYARAFRTGTRERTGGGTRWPAPHRHRLNTRR